MAERENNTSGLLAFIILLVAIIIIGAIYIFTTGANNIFQQRNLEINAPNTDDAADGFRNTFNTIIPGTGDGTTTEETTPNTPETTDEPTT
jgi:hypothetical protein